MAGPDDVERASLREAVERLQKIFAAGSALAGAAPIMMGAILDSAKRRIESLELITRTEVEEKERKVTKEWAFTSRLVECETALTGEEKEQYGSFLKKEFFTKSDFAALAAFYGKTWEKLTEGGKDEMSFRIWEGIRHGEFQFGDLPGEAKEIEAKRLRDWLIGGKGASDSLENIPAQDRADFTSAWNAGKKNEAFAVLDRPSFKENVALSTKEIAQKETDRGEDVRIEIASTQSMPSAEQRSAHENNAMSDASVSKELLGNLKAIPKAVAPSSQKMAGTGSDRDR